MLNPAQAAVYLLYDRQLPVGPAVLSVSRIAHVVAFSGPLISALLSCVLLPELWTGRTNVFSSLSGFATFYGVLFAAIEVVRAPAASEMAESAAASAQNAVLSAVNIKTLAECKTYINYSWSI